MPHPPETPPRVPRLIALRVLRWFAAAALIGGLSAAGFLFLAEVRMQNVAKDRRYSDAEAIPHRKAAVVLGCVRYLPNGRENLYFRHRIAAAAQLYHAGKVEYLVVSGDNSRKDYDEPTSMRDALVEAGIPADRIYRDFAGFRTLDSVVRASKVFGLDSLTFVSQGFHNERALYLARHHGIDAVAFDAADPPRRFAVRTRLREVGARGAAVLDVAVLRRKPKFLGPPVLLGGPTT